MSTLTAVTSTQPDPRMGSNRSARSVAADPVVFLAVAIAALITTAVGIYLTGAIDLCTSKGPIVLMITWFLLPVTGVSAIAGAAVSTRRTADRYLTALVATGLAAMWLLALVWAQVGTVIDQVAC